MPILRLKFDLEDTISDVHTRLDDRSQIASVRMSALEQLFVAWGQLVERMVYSDIRSTPIVSGADLAVPVVFADHRELRVKRDTDAGIARELKRGAVIKRPHHYAAASSA